MLHHHGCWLVRVPVPWQVTPSSALLLDVLHGVWNALQLTGAAP